MKKCEICNRKHNRRNKYCKLCAYLLRKFKSGNKCTILQAIEKTKEKIKEFDKNWIHSIPINGIIKSIKDKVKVDYNGIEINYDRYELYKLDKLKSWKKNQKKQERRKFTKEVKEKIINEIKNLGIEKTAQKYKIHIMQLYRWMREEKVNV